MVSKSTKKPSKPHPDFPLFPHATGRWAKKVKGKVHYFGKWADPQGALEKWLAEKDDLLAGRVPRSRSADGLTLATLANKFLAAKRHLLDTRELSARTWADYHASCRRVLKLLGQNRLVTDLAPEDFQQLRAALAKTLGPVSLGNEIQRIRVLFKYGYDAGLIDRPVRYGQEFKRPSKKTIQHERNKKGERMLEPHELRRILDAASQPMKTMILLALNCGYGNTDCGMLPIAALDLDGGWASFPRPKTATPRKCPLWPETVEAVREWLTMRPKPKGDAGKELVFVTKYGHPWVKTPDLPDADKQAVSDQAIAKEFRKVLNKTKLYRTGISFYSLRHMTQTIGEDGGDIIAVKHIMGHVDGSMSGTYRERINPERLYKVTDHIRGWLFGDAEQDADEGTVTLRLHREVG